MATKVLVVDDSAVDRDFAASLINSFGYQATCATDGRAALAQVEVEPPDLVLTDLLMPEMDGLELVRQLRRQHPELPIILMTGHGSESTAVEALRAGASSYVPKDILSAELENTIKDVLCVMHPPGREQRAVDCLTETHSTFVLDCLFRDHEGVIGHVQHELRRMGLCDEAETIRVGTALHEAIVNAHEHGNLELTSELRESTDGGYHQLAEQRCREVPYKLRQVYIHAHLTRREATIRVRDEGPGFDPSSLPDPTDPENLGRVSGRGLFLIRTFMDDISFNETGNEITMVIRRNGRPCSTG